MTLLVIIKATLLFAAALAVALLAKRVTADTRHKTLAGAQLAALALPLLVTIVPPLTFAQPPEFTDEWNVGRASARQVTASPSRAEARPTFAMVWLAGCAVVAMTRLVAFARALAIVRRARPFGRVLITDEIDQPSTLGRWILLPAEAQTWSAERLRAVLLHEQAHVARHDTLLGLAGDVACAVYWFHPLAWIAARYARLERERACDDRVLARGVEPGDYASAMIDVARSLARRSAAAMPMADRSQLEQRIRAILDPAVPRRARSSGALLVVAILAAAPLLAAVTPDIRRPRAIEPDLLPDAVASPYSERIEPAAPAPNVAASGPDAELIALLTDAAARAPRSNIDFVAERARWALTRVENGQLVAPLIESLDDSDWRIRAYAAWALGHSADPRATQPLIALLDSDIWRVRAMAASGLANLADPAAERAMLARIDDPAWQVRAEVVRFLGAIGGHHETLRAMRTDRHMAVRASAEEALD